MSILNYVEDLIEKLICKTLKKKIFLIIFSFVLHLLNYSKYNYNCSFSVYYIYFYKQELYYIKISFFHSKVSSLFVDFMIFKSNLSLDQMNILIHSILYSKNMKYMFTSFINSQYHKQMSFFDEKFLYCLNIYIFQNNRIIEYNLRVF